MNSLLLIAVLIAAPEEVVTFVQSGCKPCHVQQAEVGDGDSEVTATYVNCDQFLPEGVTGFPATYHPATKRMHIGRLTKTQLKAWVYEQEPLAVAEAAHTPMAEVTRVIAMLPKPEIGFVDFGCGYDARWCVAAAERWGCKVTGVEINPARAAAARERIRNLGLSHLITIVQGDATTTHVDADVGVAYLYPEVLVKLKPRWSRLRAFASYLHQPQDLSTVKNGDTWIYTQTTQQTAIQPQVTQQPTAAVWGGRTYQGRLCNNPNCQMCNSIQAQLAAPKTTATPGWRLETRTQKVRVCNGRQCWYEDRQVQVWVPN